MRYQLTTSAHNVQALNTNLGEKLTRTSAKNLAFTYNITQFVTAIGYR